MSAGEFIAGRQAAWLASGSCAAAVPAAQNGPDTSAVTAAARGRARKVKFKRLARVEQAGTDDWAGTGNNERLGVADVGFLAGIAVGWQVVAARTVSRETFFAETSFFRSLKCSISATKTDILFRLPE